MTISSALTALNTDIQNARTAITNKGGTVTSGGGSSQLATDIATIPSGGDTPTLISKTITQNGTYNASSDNADGYSSVTVNVSGSSIGIPREIKNGVYQMPTESFTFSLPSDATNVVNYGLSYAFYGCTGLTSVDLSSLTTVSGGNGLQNAFRDCTGLTSVDLSSLTTVSGNSGLSSAFYGCPRLTSVDLSSLTTVSGSSGLYYAFSGCARLTSVDLSALTTVSGNQGLQYAFNGCTALTSVSFPSLTTTSFGSYKNQFIGMLNITGKTTTHTLHFPSNLQSTISGLSGYPNFGGTSGYVVLAFDLPATS